MLPGIDVSHWVGKVDWQAVCAAGYRFAFTKATERNNYLDDTLYDNIRGAQSVGIPVGAYHFYRLDTPAHAQAEYFLRAVESLKPSLPPVLDFEEVVQGNQPAVQAALKTWLDEVEQATARKPIIYTGLYVWEGSVGNPTWATDYPLWIAQYTSSPAPLIPDCWNTWHFWQYTDKGKVPGCPGKVDLNFSSLSEKELYLLSGMPLPEKNLDQTCPSAKPVKTPLLAEDLEERIYSLEQEVADLSSILRSNNIL
jgi:lysozyme